MKLIVSRPRRVSNGSLFLNLEFELESPYIEIKDGVVYLFDTQSPRHMCEAIQLYVPNQGELIKVVKDE